MSRFRSTIECHDCHQQVNDLREHRKVCAQRRGAGAGTVECFGCHQQVPNLRDHQKVCVKRTRGAASVPVANTRDVFFVLDVSGSMTGAKLAAGKAAIQDMHATLPDTDRMAVICFDDGAFFKLRPRPNGELKRKQEIAPLMDRIFAKGGTAFYDALWIAIEQITDKTRRSLIIALTDGDDNKSTHTLDQVHTLLGQYPNITLSIVHIGPDSARNGHYETLAVQGHGAYVMVEETTEIVTTVRRFYVNA